MKKRKISFDILVLASLFIFFISFTIPEKETAPKWFEFTGNSALIADVLNPLLYAPFNANPVDTDPDRKLFAIKVDDVTEVWPAGSGTKTGQPKVDVFGSALEADILDATGHDGTPPNDIPNRVILIP